MHDTAEATTTQKSEEELKELASLARLVSYARESARELNAEFSAYCLGEGYVTSVEVLQQGA
ncbi:hypothetical protein ACC796_36510, partial [Rhizobium ruizarguesonis]